MRLLTVILIIAYSVNLPTTLAQYFYAVNASTSGLWETQTEPSVGEYLAANSSTTNNVSVTFDTSPITQDGNYSVILYTPGCLQDNTCAQRGTIGVEGHYATKTDDERFPTSTEVAQTNNYDKYDEIYRGGVNASLGDFKSSVKLSGSGGGLVVAQKIRFVLERAFTSSASAATGTTDSNQPGTATTQSGTGTNTGPTIPNVTVTASPNAPQGGGGLDQGAKIGIGIGVSLGLLLCLIIALLVYSRRKKRKQSAGRAGKKGSAGSEEADDDSREEIKAQLQGESSHAEMLAPSTHTELPEGPLVRTELPGDALEHAELPGQVVHKELPAP